LEGVPLSRAIPIVVAAYGVCAEAMGRVIKISPCGVSQSGVQPHEYESTHKSPQPIAHTTRSS
jgi:hypothetical protein